MRLTADIAVGAVGVFIGGGTLLALPSQISGETYAAIADMNSPAFFPILAGIVMMLFSGLLLAQAIAQAGDGEGDSISFDHRRQLLAVCVLIVAYTVGVRYIGMISTSTVAILALGALLGYRRWPVLLTVALGVPIVVHFLFERLLLIILPRGVLF